MEYVERTFTDEDITLDGNSFVRCIFDGCVLRYNGGTLRIEDLDVRNGGHITFGDGVDPLNNPLSQFIIRGAEAQGFTRLTDDQIAAQVPTPPKKDLG